MCSAQPEEKELPAFSGQMIDRYGVLFDLWNCHIGFMERKRAVSSILDATSTFVRSAWHSCQACLLQGGEL